MPSNTNATAVQAPVDTLELTPELVLAVLQELANNHKSEEYGEEQVNGHIECGGRDLAASRYVTRAIARGVPWRQVLDVMKKHVRAMSDCRLLMVKNHVDIAQMAGVLELVESGRIDVVEDGAREDILNAADELAHMMLKDDPNRTHEMTAWWALIYGACHAIMEAELGDGSDALGRTLSQNTSEIVRSLFKRNAASCDAFIADLRTLAEGAATVSSISKKTGAARA